MLVRAWNFPPAVLSAVRPRFRPNVKPLSCTIDFTLALSSSPVCSWSERGVEYHARRARCDVFSRADVEPPRQIGAPGPVRIGYVRRGHEVRVDVGLEAGPVVGEAVQATASDPRHPPVEVATTTNSTVAIRAGYKPDGEVGGASCVDSPGSFYIQAGSLFSRWTACPVLLHRNA